MLFKASSSAAPFSTSGVTSGGVTLSVPGNFVLVEIRALTLCFNVFSLFISGSINALPSRLVLLSQGGGSEVVLIAKSFDWPGVFASLLLVVTTPNLSMVPVSLPTCASLSWIELLRLT